MKTVQHIWDIAFGVAAAVTGVLFAIRLMIVWGLDCLTRIEDAWWEYRNHPKPAEDSEETA